MAADPGNGLGRHPFQPESVHLQVTCKLGGTDRVSLQAIRKVPARSLPPVSALPGALRSQRSGRVGFDIAPRFRTDGPIAAHQETPCITS